MNYFYRLCWILFLTLSSPYIRAGRAQPARNPEIVKAIELIFHENFSQAGTLLDSIILKRPTQPAGYFFRGLVPWRASGIVEDFSNYDRQTQKWLEKCLSVAENALEKNETDADAYFYKGGAHGFLGSMYARQKNWLKTGYHAWKGVGALEKTLELNPEIYGAHYGLGLYHIMAGHQTGIVRFLQRLLPIPSGDPEKGLAALKIAITKGLYTRTPALSALAFAYIYFEHDYQSAIELLSPLLKTYPGCTDLLMMMINALFYRELTAPQEAWNQLLTSMDALEMIVYERKLNLNVWWKMKLRFIRGYAAYSQENFPQATQLLKNYTHFYQQKQKSYLSGLGELTLGKIYDLQGERPAALAQYKLAAKNKNFGNIKQLADHYRKFPFTGESDSLRVNGSYSELPDRP